MKRTSRSPYRDSIYVDGQRCPLDPEETQRRRDGAPVYRSTSFPKYNKYRPHQGEREKARRLRRAKKRASNVLMAG